MQKVFVFILIVFCVFSQKCTDSDQKIWKDHGRKDFNEDMQVCGKQFWNSSSLAAECVQKREEYTDDCSSCFGDLIANAAKECGAQCMDPDSTACAECMGKQVWPDFIKCTGLKWGDQCTDDEDQKIWKEKGQANFKSDMQSCGQKYWNDSALASDCIQKIEGYTDTCSDCFGDFIFQCAKKCGSECMKPESAECSECVQKNTWPKFAYCTGLEFKHENSEIFKHGIQKIGQYLQNKWSNFFGQTEISKGQQCTDKDKTLWEEKGKWNFKADGAECSQYWNSSKLAGECFQKLEDYSDDCSDCFGELIYQSGTQCGEKCLKPDSHECLSCIEPIWTKWEKCTGGFVYGGLCTDDQDQKIWKEKGKKNFQDDMQTCGKEAWNSSALASQCIQKKENYTEECSDCWGNFICGAARDCGKECMKPESAECRECVGKAWWPYFENCTGLEF